MKIFNLGSRCCSLYLCDVREIGSDFADRLDFLPLSRREKVLAAARSVRTDNNARLEYAAGLLLFRHLGVHSDDDLIISATGKPYLSQISGSPIHFSLSHSGNYAVLAVSDRPLGVDIEMIKPYRPKVAQRVFSREELFFLDNGTSDSGYDRENSDIDARFFFLWTRLEAALKINGEGIAAYSSRSFSLLDTDDSTAFKTAYHDGHIISVSMHKNDIL